MSRRIYSGNNRIVIPTEVEGPAGSPASGTLDLGLSFSLCRRQLGDKHDSAFVAFAGPGFFDFSQGYPVDIDGKLDLLGSGVHSF
jgi:hypothetical protein